MSRGTWCVYTPGLRLNSVCAALSLAICTLLDAGAPEASSALFPEALYNKTKRKSNGSLVFLAATCGAVPLFISQRLSLQNSLVKQQSQQPYDVKVRKCPACLSMD